MWAVSSPSRPRSVLEDLFTVCVLECTWCSQRAVMPVQTVQNNPRNSCSDSRSLKEVRTSIICLHPAKLFGSMNYHDPFLTVYDLKTPSPLSISSTCKETPVGKEALNTANRKSKLKRSLSLSRNFRMPKGGSVAKVKRYTLRWSMTGLCPYLRPIFCQYCLFVVYIELARSTCGQWYEYGFKKVVVCCSFSSFLSLYLCFKTTFRPRY